jgi:hypothetical protein
MPDWYAESFQLALFTGSNWAQRRSLFEELAGTPPVDVSERGQFQMRQEAGPFGNAYLRVSQHPARTDIFLTDFPNRNTTNPTAPDYRQFFWIDKSAAAISLFDSVIAKLPLFSLPVQRLAYLLTMIAPLTNAKSVVVALREKLPLLQFDPDVDTDVSWQINRPRTIPAIGVINRLSKWSMLLQASVFTAPLGIPHLLPIPPQPTEFAARVEVDVNTSSSIQEISGDAVPSIIATLRALALEIAEKGDIS